MSYSNRALDVPFLELLSHAQPHVFITPLKKINEGQDVSTFLVSKAYRDIMTFLLQLNRAMFPSYIQDNPSSGHKRVQTWDIGCETLEFPEPVRNLRRLFEELDRIIDEVPPDPGPRRFGNASLKKWYQTVEERTPELLKSHLPDSTLQYPHDSSITAESELSSYFLGSFGSSQRLDYGSGHELSFLAFLGCVWKLGGFNTSNKPVPPGNIERAIVLGLLVPYFSLIRRLILTYTLEPAGSHGVWGLDDHSFIPYILGSAQYGPAITPDSQTPTSDSHPSAPSPADVANPASVARHRHGNLYFSAIGFIHDVKKGPFWEHSPMLYDISGIRNGWGKINKGMLKMYDAEVLAKFPVVQHFRFGSLFSFEPDPDAAPPPASVHAASQPVRDGLTSSAAAKVAAPRRGAPGVQAPPGMATEIPSITAAPWVTKAPPRPNQVISTTAPWAKGPTSVIDPGQSDEVPLSLKGTPSSAAESGTAMSRSRANPTITSTRFPQRSSREAGSSAPATSTGIPPKVADGEAAAQSMPPPTSAPWAKPP